MPLLSPPRAFPICELSRPAATFGDGDRRLPAALRERQPLQQRPADTAVYGDPPRHRPLPAGKLLIPCHEYLIVSAPHAVPQ
jgi:hypothetical protein